MNAREGKEVSGEIFEALKYHEKSPAGQNVGLSVKTLFLHYLTGYAQAAAIQGHPETLLMMHRAAMSFNLGHVARSAPGQLPEIKTTVEEACDD